MSSIPFSTFEGYLKKLDLGQRPEIELALFERVFPRFFTKREIAQETRERTKASLDPFWPLIQVEEDVDPPRRFAGLPLLARGRYYTICRGSSGDDGGTLVNELRAYRDPMATGRVGVADLMRERAFYSRNDILPVRGNERKESLRIGVEISVKHNVSIAVQNTDNHLLCV